MKAEKLIHTGTFKMLVSGDTIRAQKKHGQPFDFKNKSKQIFSANEIPESEDQTYAYFKRWIILVFNKLFQGDERDTDLIDKLTTEEELSGLLLYGYQHCKYSCYDHGAPPPENTVNRTY
jgi:phage/plasmid-associated DNA primase